MAGRFVVARNPDDESSLPYLLRVPVPDGELILKAREPWPQAKKVYCHRASHWPPTAEIVEDVGVRACARRGPAIDLVLDRGQRYRSQFVFTRIAGGREAIFWQTATTARAARPGVRMPSRRASGRQELTILVDTRERYPFKFAKRAVVTERRALRAGDYPVEHGGELVAVVERKTLDNLAHDLVDASLAFQLAELGTYPAAAVVVEDRYSALFKLEHVRPGWVPELLARAQARHPHVPIVFCETRALAEEWTYRYLAAALANHDVELFGPSSASSSTDPEPRRGFSRGELSAEGFAGWVPFAALPGAGVPDAPGVYVVLRDVEATRPEFAGRSPAGWFKGKDPTADRDLLARRWVDDAPTLYIGKATNLRKRLDAYRRHGTGEPVGHWGGRFVWQLADADGLLVAWCEVHGNTAEVEASLLADFEREFGSLPFANLTRGRRPRASS